MKKPLLHQGLLLMMMCMASPAMNAANSAVIENPTKTITLQIKQASDDMEEWIAPQPGQTQNSIIGDTDYNSSDIELGCENRDANNPQMAGFRFSGIPIENGRVIKAAYLQFELDATAKTTDPCVLTIAGEETDNAATYTGTQSTSGQLTSRPKMSDVINWTIPTGSFNTVDEKYNTTDIAPLVQKLVNRTGWTAGNAMAFYLTGTGTREVEAYEGEATASAKLVITYEITAEEAQLLDAINAKLSQVARLVEADYTIPSWTLLCRAKIILQNNQDQTSLDALTTAINSLQPKEMPYTVSMAINGDPTSQLGFTWYTNMSVNIGEVQIVEGLNATEAAFSQPTMSVQATTTDLSNINYTVSKNELLALTGIANNAKRNYTSHKALVTGLKANTTYSYRVGNTDAWSEIGKFTTAANSKEGFSFFYIADTQAHNDEYFSASEKTVKRAYATVPDAKFCLMTGDLVETSGNTNSEWEWEQWFTRMQPVWKNIPIAQVCGNHDKSINKNLTYHFNTESVEFDQQMSTSTGSVYSFVYGDALFIAMSTEDWNKTGYLDALKDYVRAQVAAHPEVKWKIAFYHKAIYTGSNSHQSDADAKTVREAFVPVFDEVGIDLALQGHDHIYEVIGATRNYALVDGSVSKVETASVSGVRENMTGKQGGEYDVTNGTLYFLNNSAGKKKYEPRTEAQMEAAISAHGVTNYWGLFTGKFGQTGEPTFSDVNVTSEAITITTYTVDDEGNATEFDSFKVIKPTSEDDNNGGSTIIELDTQNQVQIITHTTTGIIEVSGIDQIESIGLYDLTGKLVAQTTQSNQINGTVLPNGIYLIHVKSGNRLFVEQIVMKK